MLINLIKIVIILENIKIFHCYDQSLLIVLKEKYNSTCCSLTPITGNIGPYICSNAFNFSWQEYNDWAASCTYSSCTQTFFEITLEKFFHILQIQVEQRVVDVLTLMKSIFITMGSNAKKSYKLNKFLTYHLFEKDEGKNTKVFRVNPNQYRSAARNTGFNLFMAYAYDRNHLYIL